MLGALALAAAGFLFAAPAAHAYTINCTDISSSLTTYPYNGNAKQCNSVSFQTAKLMPGAIWDMTSIASDAYSELASEAVPFYIFDKPADYNTYVTERSLGYPLVSSAGIFGRTVKNSSTGQPIFTAIFVKDTTGQSINVNYKVAFSTVHEAGHSIDYIYRGLGSEPKELSNSQMYKDLLARDWVNFNALPSCGTGGVFNGRKSLSGLWICSGSSHNQLPLTSEFTGGNNEAVLQAATGDNYLDNAEVFSNEVSRMAGNSTQGSVGISGYLDNSRFACSMYFVGTVIQSGVKPTAANMSNVTKSGGGNAGCPTSGIGWSLP